MRVVIDSNLWLDWLVFADPSMETLKAAVLARRITPVMDEACLAELTRVLGYPFRRFAIDEPAQAAALATCKSVAELHHTQEVMRLPKCRDEDDQKFLALAASSGAAWLLSKDRDLLALKGRTGLPFKIASLQKFWNECASFQ
jgi:uncharacterized protein